MIKETKNAAINIHKFLGAKYKIKVDSDLCSGCKICQAVCSLYHTGEVNLEWARIRVSQDVMGGNVCVPETCKQCPSPWCILVSCPSEAIRIDENTGARVIDEEKCVGCSLCVDACPFGIIGFNAETLKAFKCDFCRGDPQCVKYCPTGALTFEEV